MSAMPDHAVQPDTEVLDETRSVPDEPVVAGTPVVVRRHAGVAALIGAAASAMAIAYLWRASQSMAVLDWALFGVMALVAAGYLASLVDARTPLLVADDLGIRIRAGHEWRGLPWEAIGHVVVHPRRGLLRDGRLVVVPRSLARALDGLDARGRRHVLLSQKMYGAPLAVPLGLTTRVSDGPQGVADGIEALAQGRTEVVQLDPRTLEVAGTETAADADADDVTAAPDTRGADPVSGAATRSSGAATGETDDSDGDPAARGEAVVRRETFPRLHQAAPGDRSPADEAPDSETDPSPTSGGKLTGADSPTSRAAAVPADGTVDAPERPARRSILGGIGTIVSRVAKGSGHDIDRGADAKPDSQAAADQGPTTGDQTHAAGDQGDRDAADDGDPGEGSSTQVTAAAPYVPVAALRDTRPGLRAEATLDLPQSTGEGTGSASEGRELRRPGSVDLVVEPVGADERVRPISTLGDPVAPLVIDDFVTEPAYDPVIGPEITAARTRLGLSVDELAERTRIRPHVIESIEVDDFAPCGGDFYARGHLRTLARILGKDPAPLLAMFEERYATAPVNARRVFEAELATGMTGSLRSTVGGPNWGLMIGVVLALVLVWGVLRLFAAAPDPADVPTPVINGAALVVAEHGSAPVQPV